MLPGNPLANMVFKVYSVQALIGAVSFVQDLKLGHYIKVPPCATFLGALFFWHPEACDWLVSFVAQLIASVLVAFVQLGVKEWIFANVKDICLPTQSSLLTCPHNQVFFAASVIWYIFRSTFCAQSLTRCRGLIGPSRQFGAGSIYHPQLYAIIIGMFLPFPFWLWKRRYPQSWIRWVNIPVVISGLSAIPPVTGINYSSWFLVRFVFQYIIRKHNFAWWSKFNYVTSAAMDNGTVISLIFIFFTLWFPKGGKISVNWWGNDVFMNSVLCSCQSQMFTDLLISSRLVGAGVKVSSAGWDSCEFLERSCIANDETTSGVMKIWIRQLLVLVVHVYFAKINRLTY